VIDVLFLRKCGAYLVELLETAKQIVVGLQDPPGIADYRLDGGAMPYLMQTARTCGISVMP
jgi:hypothetical protein